LVNLLHFALLSTEFDLMRRGVVLDLLARLKIVAAGRDHRRLADAVAPAKRRQCRIRNLSPAGHQFLMDSHEIPFAVAEKFENALLVRFGLLGPAQLRDFGCLHRSTVRTVGREIPSTRAISRFADSVCVQFQDRGRCAWLNIRFSLLFHSV
jgi:hypothetical protein